MYELTMVLNFDNGEVKDNTVDVNKDEIQNKVLDFVEYFYNDGYNECEPKYYELSDVELVKLLNEGFVVLNRYLTLYILIKGDLK